MRPTRRQFVATTALAALAGCTGRAGQGSGGGDGGAAGADTAGANVDEGPIPVADGPVPVADDTLPLPLSPEALRSRAVSGGPPKDGIPAIDDPAFVAAAEVTFLKPGDPVFGVARNGVVKAYPQKILVQHEIVNDALGDLPVAVTYCPLTGTVQGFERGDTTFGVSGRLINNNLVMYDRATETWWPQILATSIPGPWNFEPGTHSLREFRLVWTTWRAWRDQYPDTRVLSTDTGSARNYQRDPYGSYNPKGGYYTRESPMFSPLGDDDRFHNKRVFMGARTPDGAVAFEKDALRSKRVLHGAIGDTPAVAVYDSRFDTAYSYLNPDDLPVETGDDGVVVDGGTHDPDALPLARVHTFDAMWFAWSGYYPETNVVR